MHNFSFSRYGGCGFKSNWEQFLTKLILFCGSLDHSDNLTEMRQLLFTSVRVLPPDYFILWHHILGSVIGYLIETVC